MSENSHQPNEIYQISSIYKSNPFEFSFSQNGSLKDKGNALEELLSPWDNETGKHAQGGKQRDIVNLLTLAKGFDTQQEVLEYAVTFLKASLSENNNEGPRLVEGAYDNAKHETNQYALIAAFGKALKREISTMETKNPENIVELLEGIVQLRDLLQSQKLMKKATVAASTEATVVHYPPVIEEAALRGAVDATIQNAFNDVKRILDVATPQTIQELAEKVGLDKPLASASYERRGGMANWKSFLAMEIVETAYASSMEGVLDKAITELEAAQQRSPSTTQR